MRILLVSLNRLTLTGAETYGGMSASSIVDRARFACTWDLAKQPLSPPVRAREFEEGLVRCIPLSDDVLAAWGQLQAHDFGEWHALDGHGWTRVSACYVYVRCDSYPMPWQDGNIMPAVNMTTNSEEPIGKRSWREANSSAPATAAALAKTCDAFDDALGGVSTADRDATKLGLLYSAPNTPRQVACASCSMFIVQYRVYMCGISLFPGLKYNK